MLTPRELSLLTSPPDLPAVLRTLLGQIPAGCVTSFGDLAEALGDLQAARWVATEVQELNSEEFPVHRVIRRTGKILGTSGIPLSVRLDRLAQEGVVIQDESVDLKSYGWSSFISTKPLKLLQEQQRQLASLVTLNSLEALPDRVAGLDVSYGRDGLGVAAYVVVDTATLRILEQETFTAEVKFPYIPGYLSFRELPLYLPLLARLNAAGRGEPYVLVDGNGILHPRRAGIASLLGCAALLHTIGVSKHRLFGQVVDDSAPVSPLVAGDAAILGYRLRPSSKRSTLYVSPGAGVDVEGSLRLTQALLATHRLPEPLYHADRLSREFARRL